MASGTERLAYTVATIDGKSPAELKHLLLKEHRRVQRAEYDQNIMRMTDRWAKKMLDAAHAAERGTASPEQVMWTREGKWQKKQADAFIHAAGPALPSTSCWRLAEGEHHRCTSGDVCECPPASARVPGSFIRLSDFWRSEGEGSAGSPFRRRGAGEGTTGKPSRLSSPLNRRGTGLEASVLASPLHAAEDTEAWRRIVSGRPVHVGSANDERLGEVRGLLELMARKKIRALELLSEADSTKAVLEGTKTRVGELLRHYDSLAGEAGGMSALHRHKRKLVKCKQQERDMLNTMSCCRSISQFREIPEGWRWSNDRAMCGACRAVLHKLQLVHSKAELLECAVASEEKLLQQTKQEMADVGATAAQVLNEAIYRPVAFKSMAGTGESAHGIIFSISAPDQFPVVVTRIRCARHASSTARQQAMTVLVSPPRAHNDRAAVAAELASWTLAGCSSAMPEAYNSCLPSVSVFDHTPQYGDLPLRTPFLVEAGMQRSVALHSDDPRGIIIRREGLLPVGALDSSSTQSSQSLSPEAGLVTRVGMAMGPSLTSKPKSPGQGSAPVAWASKPVSFVGEIVYRRVPCL